VYFITCPKQGLEIGAVVLHRVAFLEYFCPKQGQEYSPLAAPLYPNMGQVPPPPSGGICNAPWYHPTPPLLVEPAHLGGLILSDIIFFLLKTIF